jgi:uncharacterized membrane protein YkvA (DUF1232 family)
MKWWNRMKEEAEKLKKQVIVLSIACRDPGVPLAPKLVLLLAIGYALSPIDLIPDFIPVLGILDDILIVPALIGLSIRLIPPEIMERARERAKTEKPELKDNWFFAVVFVLLWVLIFASIIMAIVRLFPKKRP